MFKNILVTLSSSGLLFAAMTMICDAPAQAKGKSSHRGAYLVPPPPPYSPSVLPEYGTRSDEPQQIASAVASNDHPYSKYIYTRRADDAPRVVQTSKGVTNWAHKK